MESGWPRPGTWRLPVKAHVLLFPVFGFVLLLNGCAPTYKALPNAVYATPEGTIFDKLAPELESPTVKVLYFTDRQVEISESGTLGYGNARSTRLSFGTSRVALGEWQSWDELVEWTVSSSKPSGKMKAQLIEIEERGHFPDTPYLTTVDPSGRVSVDVAIQSEIDTALGHVSREIQRSLEHTPNKEVVVYVHGIMTSFEKAVLDTAVIYHLLGRSGASVAYCWPAGGGYARDRESSEFTIFHLKQLLRNLAHIPEVENVHLLAHSRGTDIVLSALRELIIEARAAGLSARRQFKLGHLVLLAADLDLEVAEQRITAEALEPSFKRVTAYASPDDTAMIASKGLFSSRARIGSMQPKELTEKEKDLLQRATNFDLILYAGERIGKLGHSYFRSPLVLADILLLLRDYAPGADSGRPLKPMGSNIWKLDNGYLQ